MNESDNGSGALPHGFSAASVEDLDRVEGGGFWGSLPSIVATVIHVILRPGKAIT
jgi:hypothetical protein